ncbi:response regulator [Cellulophaga sp. E16_2]|uniref:dolichyl-phosphate beta-glucosyltransferase n=1 Tax=Cellulophaga algicola (strain DSM 14237 / IC166 / ACAM 630) TaxID=688270 RepID=E6XF90_CELAD|nr:MULTISPECIES: response regulator [Cellulophaga]ADV50326.1 response regulator receiver protein [Cellulophaga algicola DSM 14237]MBO0592728.1 response regulator [Cellulophaga sp. E16_2]
MKILAIDDQQLILMSLQKRLIELGYEVKTADSGVKGIELFKTFEPELVILDINMPGMTGLEVVKHIRIIEESKVPILVMSGNTDEKIIVNGFDLGIDDYMKKPVSLSEVAARVKRIIGTPNTTTSVCSKSEGQMLQQYCVGVVIPCYNEEERLSGEAFKSFVHNNLGYHLCFVNDGSTDSTLEVLEELRKGNENKISVYNCEKNGGKAEAVRQGMLHLAKDSQLDYIGYLDADLSTDFRDFDDLVKTMETSDFKIVSGSRMSRMGANITKESARKIISMTINLIIRSILKMPFNDTQCGAKIMDKELVELVFQKKFITRWLFDVEIFMRMRKHYGKDKVQTMICEQPLKRWIHADGSKLSMKDSIQIVGQLAKIAIHYK